MSNEKNLHSVSSSYLFTHLDDCSDLLGNNLSLLGILQKREQKLDDFQQALCRVYDIIRFFSISSETSKKIYDNLCALYNELNKASTKLTPEKLPLLTELAYRIHLMDRMGHKYLENNDRVLSIAQQMQKYSWGKIAYYTFLVFACVSAAAMVASGIGMAIIGGLTLLSLTLASFGVTISSLTACRAILWKTPDVNMHWSGTAAGKLLDERIQRNKRNKEIAESLRHDA